MKFFLPALFFAGLLSLSNNADAHTRWVYPTSRNRDSVKTAPCGGVAAGPYRDTVTSGESTLVRWQEFVNHQGFFTISLSTDGDKIFQTLLTVQDTATNGVWTRKLLIPAAAKLGRATLRVVQTMTEGTVPTYYYSCADILIQSPLGVEQGGPGAPAAGRIAFFPNPARETALIHFSFPDRHRGVFRLLDIRGKSVFSSLPKEEEGFLRFSLRGLAPGVYSAVLEGEGFFVSRKVVLVR